MSETAQELVERMAAAGQWVDPDLLQAIVDKGEEAVAPLLEIVRQHPHGWPAEAPHDHALGLLTHLPRSEAVWPVVLEVFRHYDDETLEILPDLLVPYGLVVVEPLLDVVRDRTLQWYCCSVASGIALHLTIADEEAFARVKAVLREELAYLVSKGKKHNSDEFSRGSSLVLDLAEAADPEARSLLKAALEAGYSEMIDEEEVEKYYRRGPKAKVHIWPSWLEFYRGRYLEHKEYEARCKEPKPPRFSLPPAPLPPATLRPAPVFPPLTPVASPPRKIGRNDPCWCGSGKKYKNCHLHTDQG